MIRQATVPTPEALTPDVPASNTDADQYVAEQVGTKILTDMDGNNFEVPVLELRLKE